jgi:hypothetical protein
VIATLYRGHHEVNHNASERRPADCRVHGPDHEPRILSIAPALPGWSVAIADPYTGEVWSQPIAVWATVERPMARELPSCTCGYCGVHAMIAGSSGALELLDEYTSRVVPPGLTATWHAKPNPHWVLLPATEAEAPAVARVTA